MPTGTAVSVEGSILPPAATPGSEARESTPTRWRWPFPRWSQYDPSNTRWDSLGGREVFFFWESKDEGDGSRMSLYSVFDGELYKLDDHGELGSPPQVPGVALSGDVLWPRADPTWLLYDGPWPYNWDDTPGPAWLKEIGDFNATREEFLAEIHTLELLRRSPHPHLPVYLGCLVDPHPWVAGVVHKRYPKCLGTVVESGEPLAAHERTRIVAELTSAVAHLHAHGLAHNDVSPWNVMLDEEQRAVLIDFGACLPFGQFIPAVRGTPGFSSGDWTHSDPAHDTYGLEAIRRFLDVPVDTNQSTP